MKSSYNFLFAVTAILLGCPAVKCVAAQPGGNASQIAQQTVAYAQEKTLQTFSKTAHGGVLHVTAKQPSDTQQIKLIQSHLFKMASDFRKGDFTDTEKMHGANMPGLAKLRHAPQDDIKYEYRTLETGAQIHFSSEYPEYVQALHEWLDAQIAEHGNAPLAGHSQHHQPVSE
jgi:hypothetical protein